MYKNFKTYFLLLTFSLTFSSLVFALEATSDSGFQVGQISFNGKASVQQCYSATNLGEEIKPEDKEYTKKVCLSNPGNAAERCFMEKKDAKEKVNDGDQIISTGQNDGSDAKTTQRISLRTIREGITFIKKGTAPSAKKEMETKEPKSCCTKYIIIKGKKICSETIGEKVKQFGELKGGQNFGNKDKPAQASDFKSEGNFFMNLLKRI